jgi:hypothetical protein
MSGRSNVAFVIPAVKPLRHSKEMRDGGLFYELVSYYYHSSTRTLLGLTG